MTNKELRISFEEYNSIEELSKEDAQLVEAAISIRKGAFSPYSHFKVGAALRLSSGTIVTGSNQENAAYPSGTCAERTAMFYASAQYPNDSIRCIAVVGGLEDNLAENPVTPCGACRQVMSQYQRNAGHPIQIILAGTKKIWKFPNVESILPFIFDNI